MHPRIDGDEQIPLEMNPEHQRRATLQQIDVQRVISVEVATVFDLEPVLVVRPPGLPVLVSRECIRYKVEPFSLARLEDQFQRSTSRFRAMKEPSARCSDGGNDSSDARLSPR